MILTGKMKDMNDALITHQKCWTADGLICSSGSEHADANARNLETLRAYVVAAEIHDVSFDAFAAAIAAKHDGDSADLDNILDP